MESEHQPTQERERLMLREEDIKDHILSQESVVFVPLERLLQDTHESCVDGRGEVGVIGTPGGNKGEFILALVAAELASGQRIDETKIEEILVRYCDIFGKFYLHSDYHALENLCGALGLDSIQEVEALIMNPPVEKREELLELLSHPSHIGCGHLRLMITFEEDYRVRKELVESAIKAFFKLFWGGNPQMKFDVLGGDHKEGAVVNVYVKHSLQMNSVPTIVPQVNGQQMFVNHPQVAEFMRQYEANRISEIVGFDVNPEDYKEIISSLGNKHLLNTVGHLTKDLPLPIFDVIFEDETGTNFVIQRA